MSRWRLRERQDLNRTVSGCSGLGRVPAVLPLSHTAPHRPLVLKVGIPGTRRDLTFEAAALSRADGAPSPFLHILVRNA